MVVTRQLEEVLRIIRERASREPPPTMEEVRAVVEKDLAEVPVPADVVCQPVDAGGIPGEWIVAPGASEERVLLYLHGGGYSMGSINTHREMLGRASRAAGARCFAIDYRLAPENPFPAGLEDCLTAYRWLLSSGVDPRKLVVGGESAGGGMTMAVLLSLRDAGDPLPAAGICISAWVDMEGTGESLTTKADVDPMIKPEMIPALREMYIGDRDPLTPLASPLYADLKGLPPLLIQVGSAEILLDDSTRLAQKAKEAGVDATLEVWDDMVHAWHMFAYMLPEAQQAIERMGDFVRQHTA